MTAPFYALITPLGDTTLLGVPGNLPQPPQQTPMPNPNQPQVSHTLGFLPTPTPAAAPPPGASIPGQPNAWNTMPLTAPSTPSFNVSPPIPPKPTMDPPNNMAVAPPPGGGWGFTPGYGWGYFPPVGPTTTLPPPPAPGSAPPAPMAAANAVDSVDAR